MRRSKDAMWPGNESQPSMLDLSEGDRRHKLNGKPKPTNVDAEDALSCAHDQVIVPLVGAQDFVGEPRRDAHGRPGVAAIDSTLAEGARWCHARGNFSHLERLVEARDKRRRTRDTR